MSDQVTVARNQEFQAQVKHLLQQQGSRLRAAVENQTHGGRQAVALDQIGTVTAVEKQARHAELPVVNVPHARRWVFPTRYEFRDFVDRADTLRMLWEPGNKYAQAFSYALGRAQDQKIIAAMTGTAVIGETGDGTSTEAFDTTNCQIAAGGVGFTLDKLKQALQIQMSFNIDIANEARYVAVSSKQYQDFLKETQVTSGDYNRDYVLENGRLTQILGYRLIHTELLSVTAASGGVRTCLVWVPSGVNFSSWEDVRTPIDWIPERQAWQVAATGDFGATRLEQGRVISVLCQE